MHAEVAKLGPDVIGSLLRVLPCAALAVEIRCDVLLCTFAKHGDRHFASGAEPNETARIWRVAFARLEELRQSGDESLDVLRGRLDKLAGDLEKAVSGFVSTLAEQAKKATQSVTGSDEPAKSEPPATTQAAQSESAPPAETDKPQS